VGRGDSSFQGNVALTVSPFCFSAGVTGDFNNDGNPDVVLLSSNLSVLLGDGTRRFSPAHVYILPSPDYAIATAD
jgi:VCBS repeat protein